jgi:hypothetical protein
VRPAVEGSDFAAFFSLVLLPLRPRDSLLPLSLLSTFTCRQPPRWSLATPCHPFTSRPPRRRAPCATSSRPSWERSLAPQVPKRPVSPLLPPRLGPGQTPTMPLCGPLSLGTASTAPKKDSRRKALAASVGLSRPPFSARIQGLTIWQLVFQEPSFLLQGRREAGIDALRGIGFFVGILGDWRLRMICWLDTECYNYRAGA